MSEEQYLRALAKYSHEIRTGVLPFDYRTGQCGPVQATQLRSWGAACPPGYCAPDRLPEALNRWFAGDRSGCRELPYTVKLSGTGHASTDVPVTVTQTSKVTICPTRIIAWTDTPEVELTSIVFGNQNQLVGGPVLVRAFDPQAFQDVPIVPDCIRAGQPFSVGVNILAGNTTEVNTWLVFIGPAVG